MLTPGKRLSSARDVPEGMGSAGGGGGDDDVGAAAGGLVPGPWLLPRAMPVRSPAPATRPARFLVTILGSRRPLPACGWAWACPSLVGAGSSTGRAAAGSATGSVAGVTVRAG